MLGFLKHFVLKQLKHFFAAVNEIDEPYHFMGNRWGNRGNSVRLYFSGLQNHCMVIAAMKLKDAYSLEGKL